MAAPRPARHGLTAREIEILRGVLAPFASKIERVCLFGSRATGTARSNSDIDLVIHGDIDEASIDRLWTLFDDSDLSATVDVVGYELVEHRALRRHIDTVEVTLFTKRDLARAAVS